MRHMSGAVDTVSICMKKSQTKKRAKLNDSPVRRVNVSREISDTTRVLLCVRAGGRCEFDGCNKYVFRHHLTHAEENFSQMAHIVAFKTDGPRGKVKTRPTEINDISNLMLLCPECHHLIDARPDEYPREVLEKYKKDHEERIFRLTAIKTDSKTSVVQLKCRIGSQTVAIPVPEIYKAISPRYAEDPQGIIIDLTNIDGQDDGFYQAAMRTIKRKVEMLYETGMEVDKTRHISLFALAPIPLLVFLGSQLSNKVAVECYQRHRDVRRSGAQLRAPERKCPWRTLRRAATPTPAQPRGSRNLCRRRRRAVFRAARQYPGEFLFRARLDAREPPP